MKSRTREVVRSQRRGCRDSFRLLLFTLHCSLFTGALGASCGLDQGDPTLIDRPRIHAMKAEPPEIQRGGESKLTALVALPDDYDSSKPPALFWGLCELSGKVTGQSCADPDSAKVLGAGGPDDSIPITDPTPPEFTSQPLPVPLPFIIGLFAKAGDKELKAFKRFVVSESTNPNRNPAISAVLIDGAPLSEPVTLEPGREYTLEVQMPDDAAQSYIDLSPAGGGRERTEDLFISWFATAEGLDKDRSFKIPHENKWRSPKKAPESGKVRFWIVLHDSREGVDWKSFELAY